jgi:hypothetical protein
VSSRNREFSTYDYRDPSTFLRALGEIEPLVVRTNLSYHARTLRTHKMRRWGQERQAALFALGLSRQMPGFSFDVAMTERQDYDAVIRRSDALGPLFMPVQLKELVPARLNARESVIDIIQKLQKYVDSADLTVCLYLNRRMRLDLNIFTALPRLELSGLYCVAAATLNRRYWRLIGDLLSEQPEQTIFRTSLVSPDCFGTNLRAY